MADYGAANNATAPAEGAQPRAQAPAIAGRPNPSVPKGMLPRSGCVGGLLYVCAAAVAEAAKNKMCKNVTIYGFCRYEGKGCAFRHDRVSDLLPYLALSDPCIAKARVCETAGA